MGVRENAIKGRYFRNIPIPGMQENLDGMTPAQIESARKAHDRAMQEWRARTRTDAAEISAMLKKDLELEHKVLRNPLADKVWELAERYGRSYGILGTIDRYTEFVALIKPPKTKRKRKPTSD